LANQQPAILANYKKYELTESTVNLYKKYAEDTARFSSSHLNPTTTTSNTFSKKPNGQSVPKVTSLSEISTYSIMSTSTVSNATASPQKQQQYTAPFLLNNPKSSEFYDSYFLFFNLDSFNADPVKLISEKSLNLYQGNIYVGSNGGIQPSENNINIYEDYISRQKLLNSTE
jgi:hypothetical protein